MTNIAPVDYGKPGMSLQRGQGQLGTSDDLIGTLPNLGMGRNCHSQNSPPDLQVTPSGQQTQFNPSPSSLGYIIPGNL